MTKQYTVVILDNRYDSYNDEKAVLDEIAEVVHSPSEDPAEIRAVCADADGICLNLAPMSADIIEGLQACRVISRYGVGFDNVDVPAATAKKIWVANVPGYCAEDVSDQALALWLSCVRKVAQRDRQVRAGVWDVGSTSPEYRIHGKVFVLCGYGAIARILHRKISGLGLARILVYDPYVEEAVIREAGAEKVSWEEALRDGDYFSIHMPLNDETRGLFNEGTFRAMKKTAMVVNTSRGPIVDEEALHTALSEGWIDSAGIDVFAQEPINRDNPLLKDETITISGHVGWYTEESLTELKTKTADNVRATLLNGRPNAAVNDLTAG